MCCENPKFKTEKVRGNQDRLHARLEGKFFPWLRFGKCDKVRLKKIPDLQHMDYREGVGDQ